MRFSSRVPQLSRAFFPVSALLLSLVFLAGCSLFIPSDPSAPRYNSVSGHRHAPSLNPGGSGMPEQAGSSSSMTSPDHAMSASAAPVPPMRSEPMADAYPPVSPETQAIAQQQMSQSPQQRRTLFQHMGLGDQGTSPSMQPTVDVSARQVPEENAQVAGNYPSLQNVPPRPTSMSDTARMNAIGQQMQQDQMNANAASARLDADAAREPMLSPLPSANGAAPMPGPVSAAPLPPPAAMAAPVRMMPQASMRQPQPMSMAPMEAAQPQAITYPMLPPPPPPLASANAAPAPVAYAQPAPAPQIVYAPAPSMPQPPQQITYAPAPQPAPQITYAPAPPAQVAYAPPPAPALEPIILHPPGNTPPLPPASNAGYQPAPLPAMTQPAAMPGGFDPMAGASSASGTSAGQQVAGATYLPDSRYTSRRAWQ